MMPAAIINLPKKDVKSFWHPESQDLILTLAAVTSAFSFWNTINIRPSILTDPGYRDQYEGIKHHMNLTMIAILGISVGFAAIYGTKGYLPAAAAVSTGAVMYMWTNNEINKHVEEELLVNYPEDIEAESLSMHTDYPEIYRPMYIMRKEQPRVSATNFQKNRRESVMID